MLHLAKLRFDSLIDSCNDSITVLEELHDALSNETNPISRRRLQADIVRISGYLQQYIAEAETLVGQSSDPERDTLDGIKATKARLDAISGGDTLVFHVPRATAETLLEVLDATDDLSQGVREFAELLRSRLDA